MFSREKCRSILFSGDKWFDQEGHNNSQNDCVYAELREAANKDFGTISHSKSWYGLESLSKVLPTCSFCPRKLHLMQLFTSKMYYK